MKEENMFDLEKSIADWRRQMKSAGIKSPVPLDELELHLRDEIERQMNSGLSGEQSFELATQIIGRPQAVRNEFQKIGDVTDERRQKFLRAYFIVFPILYSCLCLNGLLKFEMSPVWRASGFFAAGLSVWFLWMTPHFHKHLPLVRSKRARLILPIASLLSWMVCGAAFVNLVLPRLNPTQGQLAVIVLWLVTPAAVLGGLGYGLGDAARRQASPTDA